MYIDKLDDIVNVNKYNNTYHRTIKMKHFDAKPSIYIDFNKESNKANRVIFCKRLCFKLF